MIQSFREWSSTRVFSPSKETVSYIVWSPEIHRYFWVTLVHDWEEIHRDPRWFTILLRNPAPVRGLLEKELIKKIRLGDPQDMNRLREADPDLENRDPQTRSYESLEAALWNLGLTAAHK